MNQWAITVGINQYHRFQPLSYAQRDAQALRTFLVDEAGFAVDRCLLLTDSSPTVFGKSTYPTLENLQSWIDTLGQRYLQRDDVLWFFFSGYGICHEGQDYVVPIDAQPDSIATTAIPLRSIYQRLRTIPTKTVLVLLDMNRSEGTLSNET
ncbi:caspase family protein, partial [Leptolyngbya sp. FACHB-36]|uniref:caspase family protein n=1 Tax=Leptolyngbya sp. FACHB-36 TaxID=2692808 RepID=UPI0016815389